MKVPTGFDDYLKLMVTCYSRKTPLISPVQKVFDVYFNRKYTDFVKEVERVFEAAEMSFDRTVQIDVPNCKEVFKNNCNESPKMLKKFKSKIKHNLVENKTSQD